MFRCAPSSGSVMFEIAKVIVFYNTQFCVLRWPECHVPTSSNNMLPDDGVTAPKHVAPAVTDHPQGQYCISLTELYQVVLFCV